MNNILEKRFTVGDKLPDFKGTSVFMDNFNYHHNVKITIRDKNNYISLTLYLYNNPTNCKLITVDGVNSIFTFEQKYPEMFEIGLTILKSLDTCFFMHITNVSAIDVFKKHFKEVYVQEAYVRGTHTPQYHACFMNKSNIYQERLEQYQPKLINGKNLSEELTKLSSYKQEKRKKDYLENLIKKYE